MKISPDVTESVRKSRVLLALEAISPSEAAPHEHMSVLLPNSRWGGKLQGEGRPLLQVVNTPLPMLVVYTTKAL